MYHQLSMFEEEDEKNKRVNEIKEFKESTIIIAVLIFCIMFLYENMDLRTISIGIFKYNAYFYFKGVILSLAFCLLVFMIDRKFIVFIINSNKNNKKTVVSDSIKEYLFTFVSVMRITLILYGFSGLIQAIFVYFTYCFVILPIGKAEQLYENNVTYKLIDNFLNMKINFNILGILLIISTTIYFTENFLFKLKNQ